MFQLWLDVSEVPVVLGCEMWPTHLPVRSTEPCISKEFLVPVKIWFLLEFLEAVYVLWVTFLNSVYNRDKIHNDDYTPRFELCCVLFNHLHKIYIWQSAFNRLKNILPSDCLSYFETHNTPNFKEFYDAVLQWKIIFE